MGGFIDLRKFEFFRVFVFLGNYIVLFWGWGEMVIRNWFFFKFFRIEVYGKIYRYVLIYF